MEPKVLYFMAKLFVTIKVTDVVKREVDRLTDRLTN
jgi:hypothetical protein